MKEIFDFLKENWQLIAAIITLIISVVIALIRKKPVESIYADLYDVAIDACIEAEKSADKGVDKLCKAVGYACNKLNTIYPGINANKYMSLIALLIERILTTPQATKCKKEKED